MNPFHRARDQARATREQLCPGKANQALKSHELLSNVESALNIGVQPVEPDYADLGQGTAVLQREQRFIYISKRISPWGEDFCALVAHELGHWFLDAGKAKKSVASLQTLFGSSGSPAVVKVEAYGARERQELQANVYARELLLPRNVAKALAHKGCGAKKIAKDLGIPLEFVRQQMLDALLLPETESAVSPLNSASPDQYRAARASERAANVVAGPGTGKTSTLIHRVKYLVEERKVDPNRILVLTFTNKAAFELVERLRGARIDCAADIWAGTFHAFGLELMRKYHQRFGLDSDVRVADKLSSVTMLAAALPGLALQYYLRVDDPHDWLGPVIDGIKRLKEDLISPSAYGKYVAEHPAADEELQRRRKDVAALYEAHERLLAVRRTIDFGDLIGKPALALKADRNPFAEFVDQFEHILVDEYQDVTQAMVELLRQLAQKARTLWVVGDIRQAIHHWRGASLKSLLKFDAEFKAHAGGSKIQRYPLDTNRRSSSEILGLVQEIGRQHKLEATMPLDAMIAAKGASGVIPKLVTCAKRDELLSAVVDNVAALQGVGVRYGDQAVLCRKGADVEHAFTALEAKGLPVVHIGELAQRAEIKHLLCLMQLLVERQPRAMVGLADVPGLAMPMEDIRQLLALAESMEFQRGRWIHNPPSGLSKTALKVIARLQQLIAGKTHSSNPWAFVCDVLLEHGFGLPPAGDDSVAAWVQRIALWQFVYGVRNGDGEVREARLSRFLLRQRLRQRIGETYADRELPPEAACLDGVRLLTVHGSKGLEFEAVHVAYVSANDYGAQSPNWSPPENVVDLVPPEALGSSAGEYEFEEAVERNNLLYVAVSRAKKYLTIYQEMEFGPQTLTPQFQHYPPKFVPVTYTGTPFRLERRRTSKAFVAPTSVKLEHFDSYAGCSLRYWYSQVLDLKSEAAADVSMRARWAVMSALRDAARLGNLSPDLLDVVWTAGRLPTATEDPTLWRDASQAYSLGIKLISKLAQRGGRFAEPTSIVGGITIQLPWGFVIASRHSVEFALVRFCRRGVADISTILRPIVAGLSFNGSKTLTLHHVLSDKVDTVLGAKRLELTKSFKAAVKMMDGEVATTRGRHCGRCSYLTICPTSPPITS